MRLFDLYRLVWHYARGMRGRYVGAMALLAGSQVLKLGVPWLAAQAIDAAQRSGADATAHAAMFIAGVLGVYVCAWAMHGPGRVIERSVGLHVRRAMTDALYAKLASLPLEWHEQRHSGELHHRLGQATHGLYDFTQNQFIYLQNLVNIVGPLVALTLLSTATGAIAIAGYLAVALAIVAFDRVLMRLADEENRAERRFAATVLDMLGNVSTVLSLRLQAASRRLVGTRLAAVFAPLRTSIVVTEVKWCAVDLLSIGLTWSLVIAYAWRAHATGGVLMLGGVFMVYQYAQQAGGVIGAMAAHFQNFSRIRTDVASAAPIWDGAPRAETAAAVGADWQRIVVRGLAYAHDVSGEPRGGLHDATLTIERGERIALVGPSGGGKSTLMRTLAGLYPAQRGTVSIDGVPHLDVRHLASIATFVPQEAEVFEASVRDNLTFGAACDDGTVVRAAHIACFDAVVDGMPSGYDTPLSERGVNLSGGQRQRLALARGLIAARDSSLVLLDEPTSALDQITEARVFERLRTLPDTTVIASVHRMSALASFDKIVLMVAGRIVDVGTIDELARRQPIFDALLRGARDDDRPGPRPQPWAA